MTPAVIIANALAMLTVVRHRQRRRARRVRLEHLPAQVVYVEKTRRGWLDHLIGRY